MSMTENKYNNMDILLFIIEHTLSTRAKQLNLTIKNN